MSKFYVKCTDFALATWETRSARAALHACGSRLVLRWDVATRTGRRRTVSAQESELIWLFSYLVSALQNKGSCKRLYSMALRNRTSWSKVHVILISGSYLSQMTLLDSIAYHQQPPPHPFVHSYIPAGSWSFQSLLKVSKSNYPPVVFFTEGGLYS